MILVVGAVGVFYFGSLYSNLMHLQESIVTKKDLELVMSKFSIHVAEIYVKKEDCVHRNKIHDRLAHEE